MILEPQGMRVIAARPEDLAEIVRIEQTTPSAPHWSAETYSAMLQQEPLLPLQRCLLVAKDSGQVLGFAVGKLLRIAGDTEAELESIAVDDDARRRGVGRALCAAAVCWAAESGVKEMKLEVRASNATARAFYQRVGWVESGLRRGYYQHPADDAVSMSFNIS